MQLTTNFVKNIKKVNVTGLKKSHQTNAIILPYTVETFFNKLYVSTIICGYVSLIFT